ncbi:MAG: hypothetical protein JNJ45_06805 [Chthonomonas sp.]|nr:hypothetical protein [Chthonomonas sp.]
MRVRTPWIYSAKFDAGAILGPPILITLVVLIWGRQIVGIESTPTWLWIFLVLGVDVAHVYSSLFRTYFDKEEFQRRRSLYIIAPLVAWLGGMAIYMLAGPVVFWAGVAYFAIYHFVRQQYGFLMLYRRGEPVGGWDYRIDQTAIYLATIYPLIYWHTYGREFQWFDSFEVIRIPSVWPDLIARAVTVIVLAAFLGKEIWRGIRHHEVNVGKVTLLVATAAAWGTGIILFNGDLTFTLINIISHGIPYMALVWIYQYRKRAKTPEPQPGFLRFFQLKFIPIYVLLLVGLAYFEEGIWDLFVWKEHPNLFGSTFFEANGLALMILVPLLTMPQVTHYILDAYIWRVNKKGQEEVRAVLSSQ